ncbi:hypothetical protein Bhyg_00622 [Pseudolycoriella hygida]|uniref:MARVEL domain-containing protein n=1 Tax=Pseudolycoriella hygida TaxID=35572 RepID=A0A9Q0N7V4_9DIPT|nr:hypothetical protein Bhyg_00622 [Pseudolycoriella hygida]
MGFKITLIEVGIKTCALRLSYLKTFKAILKIAELLLSAALVATTTYYFQDRRVSGDLFFLLVIANYFLCTFCLFISEWIVWSSLTVNTDSKSMFGLRGRPLRFEVEPGSSPQKFASSSQELY